MAATHHRSFEPQSINDAQWGSQIDKGGLNPVVAKAQILLSRAHFSPGEVDGKSGENFKKRFPYLALSKAVVTAAHICSR